jgi:general secretion pathway protein C
MPVSMPAAGKAAAHVPKAIDRRELSDALSDIPLLLLQAQPVPSFIDGRFNGLQLDAVRVSSFFNKIGLQSGDVLKRMNGVELRDPGMLITVLQQMKEERQVKLDILRNDTPSTLTYEIR